MTAALAALSVHEKRVQMGENGRQIAMRHNWDNTADRVAELYHQLITDRNHSFEFIMKSL
jgi:glycosyltransferase involved in cell wall biosynthesis